jgi:hypothetical protein
MGISTEFRDGILHSTIEGELTLDQAIQHVQFIVDHYAARPTLKEFMDFAACESVRFTSKELRTAVQAGGPLGRFDSFCLAIHAPVEVHYGLSMMFQTFHEIAENPIEIEIFRDRPAALAWLEER